MAQPGGCARRARRCWWATASTRSAALANWWRSMRPTAKCSGRRSSGSSSGKAARFMPMANSTSPCMSPLRRRSEAGAVEGNLSATANCSSSSPATRTREILSRTVLTGKCYGSPVGLQRQALHADRKEALLLWQGGQQARACRPRQNRRSGLTPGAETQLQIIPYEVLLWPGDTATFRVRALDANGFTVEDNVDPKTLKWEPFIPPTALVKVTMNGASTREGQLVAIPKNVPSARDSFKASLGELKGYFKGRILPEHAAHAGLREIRADPGHVQAATSGRAQSAWSRRLPSPIRRCRGMRRGSVSKFGKRPAKAENKALVKTIDNKRLQRGTVFINRPDLRNYTHRGGRDERRQQAQDVRSRAWSISAT